MLFWVSRMLNSMLNNVTFSGVFYQWRVVFTSISPISPSLAFFKKTYINIL